MPPGSLKYSPFNSDSEAYPAGQPHECEVAAHPSKEYVEEERWIEEVVRIERAGREAQRARHDRDFVGVVDVGQPVLQPDDAEEETRNQAKGDTRTQCPLFSTPVMTATV